MGLWDWMENNAKNAREQKLREIDSWSDEMINNYLSGYNIGVAWADNDTNYYYCDLVEEVAKKRGLR